MKERELRERFSYVEDYPFTLSSFNYSVSKIQCTLLQKNCLTSYQGRKRNFQKHARPWKYSIKPLKPGQMVQINHMSVSVHQVTVKHFQAWDPKSKYILANAYPSATSSSATSSTAKRFLLELIQKAPSDPMPT